MTRSYQTPNLSSGTVGIVKAKPMKLFESVGPRGKLWTIPTFLHPIVSTQSREDAISQYLELATKAEKYLGRPLTPHEMRSGLERPPLSKEQIAESRRAKVRAERAACLEAEASYSPEAERLKTARERAEQERVASLSPAQRELESAAKAAEEAEQHKADRAKKDEIRQSSAYLMVRSAIDDLILVNKLSADVSAEQVALVEAQSRDLETHLDLAATRQNLAQLQKVVSGQLAVQDAELRAATDRAELRKRMLASGQTWDDVGVEVLGETEYVSLTVGSETRKVTKTKFDSRLSDEALRSELFNGGEVANV